MQEPQSSSSVLVIGGTSFIGRATVRALLDAGHVVTICNRGQTPNPFGDAVAHRKVDRRRRPDQLQAVLSCGWDAVIDLVAFDEDDVQPILAAAVHLKRYIFISTDSVYMACEPSAFVFDDRMRLLEASDTTHSAERARRDEYGNNKLAAENALRRHGGRLDWLALRLPDVLGPHENTGRQEKLFLKLAKGRTIGSAISGTNPDAGATLPLSLVFADDVASAAVAALRLPMPFSTRALHICAAESPTWQELVHLVADSLRSHGVHVPEPRFDEARDTGLVSVDCGALSDQAARSVLAGWIPKGLEPRVDEAVTWWVQTMREQQAATEAEGTQTAAARERKRTSAVALAEALAATRSRETEDFRFYLK